MNARASVLCKQTQGEALFSTFHLSRWNARRILISQEESRPLLTPRRKVFGISALRT